MNLKRVIGKGMIWSTTSTIVIKVVVLANIFIALRYLTVHEYGTAELVFSVLSMLKIFSFPGLTQVVLADLSAEYGKREYGRVKTLLHQHLAFNLFFGIISWGVLFFGSSLVAAWTDSGAIGLFLKIVSFYFLTGPLRVTTTTLATVNLRYIDSSLYPIVEEIIKGIFLGIFLIESDLGVAGFLLAGVLCEAGGLLLFLPRTFSAYRTLRGVRVIPGHGFWKLLQFHRKWSVVGSYVATLGQNFQIWIVRALLGTEAVAYFAFVTGFCSHIMSLLPLSTVMAPILPRYVEKTERFIQLVKVSLKTQFLLSTAVVIGAAVFAPLFIRALFPKYLPALPLLEVWFISVIPASLLGMYTLIFAAMKEQFSYLFSTSIKLIATVVVFPICIQLFGMLGVGYATIIVVLVSVTERNLRLRRTLSGFSLRPKDLVTVLPHEKDLIRLIVRQLRTGKLFSLAFE